jgi:parallel beta-helix repeat protein
MVAGFCTPAWAAQPTAAASVEASAHIFKVSSEAEMKSIASTKFRGGDVIVVSSVNLTTPYHLARTADSPDKDGEEPTYIVGQAYFDAVLRARGFSEEDITHRADARNFLSAKNALPASHKTTVGAEPFPYALTALSMQQLNIRNGAWSISGFDIVGYTDKRVLIGVGPGADTPTRLIFSGNRISNCDPQFLNCRWSMQDQSGAKQNGGHIIRINKKSAGTELSNNVFEYLRGFLIIIVDNDSTETNITNNSFRHLHEWGSNAGEVIHLGTMPIVATPTEEPAYSHLNSVVAYNEFIDASGENELIGVKSSGNRIIGNTITDSAAGISLRDGSDTLIEGNTIVRSLGIRVMGDRQTIIKNHVILPRQGYGVWFENGAPEAGYRCSQVHGPFNTTAWIQSEPLRWIYRRGRDLTVSGNTVEVRHGEEAKGIAIRNVAKKQCGQRRCDGDPSSAITCDQQLSDAEMDTILNHASNKVISISQAPDSTHDH